MLISKNLLEPGRALFEAIAERLEGDILTHPEPIREGTALEAVRAECGTIPTAPDPEKPDTTEAVSVQHLYAAIQAGYTPNDPALFWLQPAHIEEFFPSCEALLRLETELLCDIGEVLVKDGRARAFQRLQELIGTPGQVERRDWASLAMAHIRDFQSLDTEDERRLMVARLDELARDAREQLDLGKALSALRMMAQIQGLTFQDKDREHRAFALLFNSTPERSEELARPQQRLQG